MKVAISSTEKKLESVIDSRFGRCQYFVIYDTTTKKHDFVDNSQSLALAHGAGIQTAQVLVDKNVDAVVTGYCGPKAFKVLEAASIKVYTLENETVEKAINAFLLNKLQEISAPNH